METRQLGTSDVRVTPVTFGAWAIGGWMWGGNDDRDAIDAIRASIDHGVTTIDTAAIYGTGHSERLVGEAIKGRRDKVVVATKCGMRWNTDQGTDPWNTTDREGKPVLIVKSSKPESIAWECEQSLQRLGTDVIDLYQIHWPDVSTPVEDSMAALMKLKDQGKIRTFGVSNYDVEWLRNASKAAPVASNQPAYSLIQRKIEQDMVPFAIEHKIGLIVYSPLERGLLTGKVTPERTFNAGDHRAKHKFFTVENRKRVLAALERIKPIAEKYDASYAQIVINWTVQQPGITAALVGARNAEQAAHNAQAMKFKLTTEELRQVRLAFDEPARELNATPGGTTARS